MSNNKFSSLPQNEIIDLYLNQKYPINKIAKIFNVSNSYIRNSLKNNNIERRPRGEHRKKSVSEETINHIIDLHVNKNMSIEQIRQITKVGARRIHKIFQERGINVIPNYRTRIYKLNENYFSEINSDDHAYWLGFLLADGNISIKKYCIRVSLSLLDIEILEKFKKSLESDIPIKITHRKKANGKTYSFCTIRIDSKRMAADLRILGMIPKKSLIMNFPNIDKKYIYSLLRGYIDGDGCIKLYRNEKSREFHLSFLGAKDFIEKAIGLLNKEDKFFNIYQVYTYKNGIKRKIKGLFNVKSGRIDKILQFLENIYKDDNGLHLDRKYESFLSMKQELVKNPFNIICSKNCLSKR